MAHLPANELANRRLEAFQDILDEWHTVQGNEWYAIQCPCRPDCGHMPPHEIPRLILSSCLVSNSDTINRECSNKINSL